MAKDLDPTSTMAGLYGTRLKRLRLQAGWTQEYTGSQVHVVASRISQLEGATGSKPTPHLTRALDEVLGGDGLLVDLLPYVLREAFPDWSRRFLELAERATVIREYSAHLVPGILQTEDYARAVLGLSRTLKSPEQLEERVMARLARQERLNAHETPELWVILDEAILHRPIGGAAVMREQLAHLLRVAASPNVTVQVLPFSSGEHGSLGGSLHVLTMPDGSQVAYTEGSDRGQLMEETEEVTSYARLYDRIGVLALPPAMSIALIRSVMEGNYGDPRVPSRPQRRRLAQVQLHQPGGGRLRRGGRRLPPRDPRT